MADLDDLVARLRLDISDYEKNAKKAEKATDSLEKETEQLQETNEKTGDSFDRLMTAFTGLNQAVQLVQQVFQTLKQGYDAVITSTLDYAEEVRTLGRTIGSSAEESSKLIQAADDVKVSYEDLMTGMNIAIRNGLEPTIEGMGQLADQYNSLNDPIARTKFLLDNFGRSGANLAPMMELGAEGIKALGEEAEATGLVLDGKAVRAARRLEIEMDGANDAMAGLATTIGNELIPSIADLLEIYNDAIGELGKGLQGQQKWEDERDEIIATSDSVDEAKARMDEYYNSQDDATKSAIDYFEQVGVAWTMTAGEIGNSKDIVNAANADMADGYYDVTEATFAAQQAAAQHAINLAAQETIIANYDGRIADLKKTVGDLTTEYQNQATALREDLAGAYGELAAAEDQWRNGVGSSIKGGLDQALEDGLISLSEYETKLGILDQYAGTQYAYEFKIEQNIPELVESLLTDPESFVTKAQAFEDYFMPLDESIKDAETRIGELKAELVSLERNYNVKVMIYSNAQAYVGVGADMAYEDYKGPGEAGGGIVHHLSPVTVGEFGPEPFVPAMDGRILSHADAMNAIGSGSGDNDAMLSMILLELRDLPQSMKVAMQEAVALMEG